MTVLGSTSCVSGELVARVNNPMVNKKSNFSPKTLLFYNWGFPAVYSPVCVAPGAKLPAKRMSGSRSSGGGGSVDGSMLQVLLQTPGRMWGERLRSLSVPAVSFVPHQEMAQLLGGCGQKEKKRSGAGLTPAGKNSFLLKDHSSKSSERIMQ